MMLRHWSRLASVGTVAAIGLAATLTRPHPTIHAQSRSPQPRSPPPTAIPPTASMPASASPATTPSTTAACTLILHTPSEDAAVLASIGIAGPPVTPEQQRQCEAWKEKAITNSRKVDYLLRALGRLGCVVDPRAFISCVSCSPHASGAALFHEDIAHVLMSAQGIKSWDQFETVLTHELIHVFDHCKYQIDPMNVRHHACMEVRASNLSGDCSFKREFMRGDTDITAHQPKCVKRRALMSILASPHIESVEQARKIVEDVYERCAADTEPFGSVPW